MVGLGVIRREKKEGSLSSGWEGVCCWGWES